MSGAMDPTWGNQSLCSVLLKGPSQIIVGSSSESELLSETVDAYLTCFMNFISCVSAATRVQAVSSAASESPVLQTTSEELLLLSALWLSALEV